MIGLITNYLQDNRYIDPNLLTSPSCECGMASVDHQCPLLSPNVVGLLPSTLNHTDAYFAKERPYSLGLDGLSSYANPRDIESVGQLNSPHNLSHRATLNRPLAPLLQLNSRINEPPPVQRQIQDTYTPGYVPDYPDQPGLYSSFPNLTPTTTVPSIYEEGQGSLASISCKDFLGKGRHEVQLHCDWEFVQYAEDFKKCINDLGYRVSITNNIGVDSALEAIQKGTGYYLLQDRGRLPSTIDQLRVNLRNAKLYTLSTSESVTSRDLYMVLNICGDQYLKRFNLGVISPMPGNGGYKFEFHHGASSSTMRSVWVFHDPGTLEKWSAVIPNFRSPPISYAAALVMRPPKESVAMPAQNSTFGLLSPSAAHSRVHSPIPNRNAPFPLSIARNRSGSASRASPSKRHHMTHTTSECGSNYSCDKCQKRYETPSGLKHHQRKYEVGEKNHQCDKCSKRFLYPKDLNRHRNTHLKNKFYHYCQFCNKKYTRKDNLQRHLRDDHDDRTPPEPSEPIPIS
jgi:hypothetical protein